MESPFIFPEESSESSISLNPDEKNQGFVYPWWRAQQSGKAGESLPISPPYEQHVVANSSAIITTTPEQIKVSNSGIRGMEEGRTFILLFSVVFFLLIVLLLIIWVKRMKNVQQAEKHHLPGSPPDYDTATEMKEKLPTYREAAESEEKEM